MASEGKGRGADRRAIGVAGTAGRLVLGVVFLGAAVVYGTDGGLQWYEVALGALAGPVGLLSWQLARTRWNSDRMTATGSVGFVVNFAVTVPFFMSEVTRDATLVFYGGSLLLAAVRG